MFPEDVGSFSSGFPGAVASTMSPMGQLVTLTMAKGERARGRPQHLTLPWEPEGFWSSPPRITKLNIWRC